MKKIVTLLFLFLTIQNLQVSFYLERNPNLIIQNDFLSILVSDNQKTNRLVFKLPTQLGHQETFTLLICKKHTFELINAETDKEKFLQDNCLNDIYNTLSEVNYNVSTILEEKNNNGIFKLCVFGFALPEAEKSFLMTSIYELETKKELSGPGLYYTNPEEIVAYVSEAEKLNYRKLFQKKSFQCKLQFSEDFNLDYSKFDRNIFYLKGKNTKSQLIIEYDFEQNFKPEIPNRFEQFYDENQNPLKVHAVKSNLIKQLSQKFDVEKQQFKNTIYNIALEKYDDKNFQFSINFPQLKIPIQVPLIQQLEKNKYLRFIPVICYDLIKLNKIISYSFLSEYKCEITNYEKILITLNDQNEASFIYKQNKQVFSSKKIGLQIAEMDLLLRKGKYSLEISNYEKKCDQVLDNKENLIYLICYQRQMYKKKNKIINLQEDLSENSFTFLILENSQYVQKKQNKIDPRIMQFVLAAGLLTCGIGVGLLFVNIVAGIIIMLVGIIILIIYWLRNRKFGYSYQELLIIKKNILKQSQSLEKVYEQNQIGVVQIPIFLKGDSQNFEEINVLGIPDLDSRLIVDDDNKLLRLHDLQSSIILELDVEKFQNTDEDHLQEENGSSDSKIVGIGFDVDDLEFDLGVQKERRSIAESKNSDSKIEDHDDFDFLIQF